MRFTILENGLWAAGFAGNLILLAILFVKKRYAGFPIFASSIAYQLIETVTLFGVSGSLSNRAYFVAYWCFAVGDYVFQLAVVFEMAKDVLRPTGTWVRAAQERVLLLSAGGVLIAAAFAAAMAPPEVKGPELWSARSSLFTSFLTCEVFLAMSSSANRLGLQWRSHVMSLGQGLTFWAAVALSADIAHYSTGWKSSMRMFDIVRSVAYVATVFFWAFRFYLPESRKAPLSTEMQKYLLALHHSVQRDLDDIRPEKESS